MKLVMVTVPDCPNAPTLERRLLKALDESGVQAAAIERRTVSDAGQAARWQMRGSPTLLIDGRDPFADPAMATGLACRMYRDEQGRLEGAPSVPALVAALRHALDGTRHQALAHTGGPDPNGVVPGSVPGSVPVWADALGRADAGRAAPVEGGLRAVHQQVLRGFAATGAAPPVAELTRVAAPYGVSVEQVLGELHAADFLRLDDDGRGAGQILAAYPFSASATRHRVQIDGGPAVFAMCAIDALGIAAMLGRDVRITSADPHDGRPVTVEVTAAGQACWSPASAVVYAGQQAACDTCPPAPAQASAPGARSAAAEVCCGYVNFFADSASARTWAEAHPQVSGQVLDQQAALQLGVAIFGPLLAETDPQ
ncbi:alkylmercury lyase family protein [Nonomuraea sp. SBT364]|uniref:alkylmercury lyase family protein n=1 Tax=Nonomuraea sp. SBT364 TaxID=1580530 RepID=UPI00066D545D|nr:alkylmercury lyase family protein [Nonomuraea sp. SBT364]